MRYFTDDIYRESITLDNYEKCAIVVFVNNDISFVIHSIKYMKIENDNIILNNNDTKYIINKNGILFDEYGNDYCEFNIIDVDNFIKEFKSKLVNDFGMFYRHSKLFTINNKQMLSITIKYDITILNQENITIEYKIDDIIDYVMP